MIALLLLGGGIAVWAWATGRWRGVRSADLIAGVAAAIGIELLRRGSELPALIALAGAGVWGWRRWRRPTPQRVSIVEARLLLDVAADADAATIRAAHRRLIARVHPDAGGSTELARRVNLARDVLLAPPPGAADPAHARQS